MSSRLKAQSGFAGQASDKPTRFSDMTGLQASLCCVPALGDSPSFPLTLASSSSPVSILVRHFDSCASIASVPVSCLSCTSYLRARRVFWVPVQPRIDRTNRGGQNKERGSCCYKIAVQGGSGRARGWNRQGRGNRLLLLLALTLGLGLGVLGSTAGRLALLLVDELEELERGLLGGVDLLADGLGLDVGIAVETLGGELLGLLDEHVELLLLLGGELLAELLHGLGGLGADRVGAIGLLDDSLAGLVGLGVLLGVGNHLLDLVVAETRTGRDGHGLVLVGRLVERRDVHDTVGVDVEGDLNLRNTLGRGGDAGELEVAEQLVVANKLTLALVDLDVDGGLAIGGGREDLRLLGGDGGVAVDQTREDTSERLDTERKRGNVEQQNVGDLAGKHTTLDGGADGDSLVGVDTLAGVTLEDVLDGLEDLGHTAHTTDHDDLLDVRGLAAGVRERLLAWLDGAVNELADEALELGTRHLGVDVLGARGVSGDVGQADVGRLGAGELNLGLLGGLTDTLDGHAVLGEVEAGLLLELADEVAGSGLLHLADDESTDLRGRVLLATGLEPGIAVGVGNDLEGDVVKVLLDLLVLELAADETLGGEKGGLGVDDSLALGGKTNETLAILGEGDDGRGGAATFRVLDDTGLLALHDRDTRVGGYFDGETERATSVSFRFFSTQMEASNLCSLLKLPNGGFPSIQRLLLETRNTHFPGRYR
ncbi:hypothetical protein L1887_52864 [Cichorium endivia]|nr:hypothetical protein L1887_52864 [Cichorium endivia]